MKIKQSKTIEVKRSLITMADYNPRKQSEEVIKSIKKNFKKVGFLGGLVWNKTTGNLVSGHKRLETLDIINKYDGVNDYVVKVEEVEMDRKTEIEQNIYMNNKAVQGEFDYKILSDLSVEIDFENTGLTDLDIDKIAVFAPPPPELETSETPKIPATPEQIEKIKQLKKDIKADHQDHTSHSVSHLTIVFQNYDSKASFSELFGIDIDKTMIDGDEFMELLDTI